MRKEREMRKERQMRKEKEMKNIIDIREDLEERSRTEDRAQYERYVAKYGFTKKSADDITTTYMNGKIKFGLRHVKQIGINDWSLSAPTSYLESKGYGTDWGLQVRGENLFHGQGIPSLRKTMKLLFIQKEKDMRKEKEMKNIIEIEEEVKIGNMILEEGDRISILNLKEDYTDSYSDIYNELNQFKQIPLNVWFVRKDNEITFGSEKDSPSFLLTNVDKDSLTFENIKDGKELFFDFLYGNVTIFNIEVDGFKLYNNDMTLYVMG